jgi:DNA-binding NarL/FixJ family response regulator
MATKVIEDRIEDGNIPSPLAILVGFEVANELYDLLSLREQIVLDLLIENCSQSEIARVLGLGKTSISVTVQSIRIKLAKSKLHDLLETRATYRSKGRV